MTKRKKLAAVALCMLLMACMPLLLFGCSTVEEEPEEDQTYDVAIRIGCSDGMIYEFPVGEDEKHVTIPYDGMGARFGWKATICPTIPAMATIGLPRAVKALMCLVRI